MMRFNRPSEPDEFDQKVRQPGNLWLEKNPDLTKKLPDYWSRFKPHLADGFHNLCGYSVMYEPVGTVDHYLSRKNYRYLAYQWSNYRFVSGWINSSKQEIDDAVLDPFEVEDNWFEIQLPSLELALTDAVPTHIREKAEFTLRRLHLRDDEGSKKSLSNNPTIFIVNILDSNGYLLSRLLSDLMTLLKVIFLKLSEFSPLSTCNTTASGVHS
jgi:hypothetical protein